jgi:predicted amidohydrolase
MAMAEFKIAAAQVASVRGDVAGNLSAHAEAVAAAGAQGVAVLVFPELSLTGYEPDLAAELAITAADSRLDLLRTLAQRHGMAVVVGAPLDNGLDKPKLGAIVLAADGSCQTYAKIHLGASERAFFTPGNAPLALAVAGQTIGLAICADSSQPTHPRAYADARASVYAAGVFLNAEWYATDSPRLAGYAAECRMLVVMANHADSVGTLHSVGGSAVWAPGGGLLAQANGVESCLVVATYTAGRWRGEVVEIGHAPI